MTEIPIVDENAISMFKIAYMERYPEQDLPNDIRWSMKRMIRRRIGDISARWVRFVEGQEQSFVLYVDQYYFIIKKNPLKVAEISAIPMVEAGNQANPIHYDEVVFTPKAIDLFKKRFPRYVEGDVDVMESARTTLKLAHEHRAISDSEKASRLEKNGPARYLRYRSCLFVLVDKEDGTQLVVAIESTYHR